MKISLIAALDEEGGIGKDGSVPWRYCQDLSFFKEATAGSPCIFGRKTFDTFKPKDAGGRSFYVLSRQTEKDVPDVVPTYEPGASSLKACVCSSLAIALDVCRKAESVFICGGGEVYRQTLPYAHELLLTRIPGKWDCDVFFPRLPKEWRCVGSFGLPVDEVRLSVDIMRKFTPVAL